MMMASPKLMDKDEQLQLCIQRFVSDTQSMINQFSEVFIGELRRFADVCMEFSVAYRGVQEERQFLTAENKSLKDELEARTAEVDFLGKELREIREENDELIRRLECFNINSEGEFSMGSRSNSVRSRPYAVVNSMPAFPRRFSEAIGYGPLNSACDNRKVSVDINLSTDLASTSKTQILLTPPVPFKNNGNDQSLSSKTIGEETTPTVSTNSNTPRYHSRDKIALCAHLLNNSDNQLTKPSNSSTSMTNERSPSVDEIRNGPKMMDKTINNGNLSPLQSQILSNAVSSSAGTFYDCCSRSNIDVNDSGLNSNRKKLLTVTDQIRQILDNHKPNETNIYVNQKLPPLIALSPAVMTDHSSERNDPINENHVINVEPKQLKKRHSITTSKPLLETDINHHGNSFIAKSPSPNVYDFDRHFDKYRCDTDLVASSGPDIDEDVAFLLESPPVQRYNSKKIAKKRKNRRKIVENKPVGDVVSDSILQNGLNTTMMKCADAVSVIPSPHIDLNRYLLVEVCHIISPSHFYLIVNDEKVGTNAFEDFLEHFQNFYKSIEEESYQRSFEEHADNDDEEERDLRLLVSIPPPAQALTLGSFWACYIDDELDWRRIQIIGDSSKKPGEITDLNGEDLILVKDVDSGYSSMVHSQMIRPLTDEMARVPAFAIRASLAFIYPHLNNNNNNNNVKEENTMKNINHKDHHHSEYYDQWPMECCQFFEDMTYDQILTASVLQINQEVTPSDETDIAQVLLWCTSKAEDFEVFINRKLIELNYATNIADDDSWMEQFSDMNMNQSSAVACFEYPPEPRPKSPPSIETCFNIQLTNVANATVSASFQPDQLNQTKQPTCNGSTSITGNAEMVVEKNDHDDQPTQSRKIKIKTRSKKKKGSLSETREENKECPESSDPTTATVPQPAAQISMIGGVEEKKETIIKSSSSIVIQDPTNSSLQSSQEHESKNSKTASNDQSPPPPLYWFAATSLLLFLISFYITSIA